MSAGAPVLDRDRALAAPPSAPAPGGLDALLRPRSIAVIGASRERDSIGREIFANLIRYGFTGPVYPINPRAPAIQSVRAYPSVAALPEPVDLAIVAVPKARVAAVAEQCGQAGVRGLVVISAGFKETGGPGAAAEQRLVEIVRRYGMRMVGPNCMGVLNGDPAVSMNATFAPTMPPFGPVAFVSQSGALGLNVLDYAREYGIGIAQFVSVGNKPDVSGNDLLLQWENDPAVGVILMYVENFGNPRRFLEIASRITKVKPIIVVKGGRSGAGARAASSHTGALAASDVAVEALLAQAGVLRADSIEELFDMATAFRGQALPRSRRTAVVTNAGGPGILVADALAAEGLTLGDLDAATLARLRPLFPPEASIRNPLDMIATATAQDYRTALATVLADPGVDSVVAIFVPPLGVRQEEVAGSIAAAAEQNAAKPVLAVLMGREGLPQGRAELHRARIPAYVFPESAARALGALRRQREWQARPAQPLRDFAVDRAGAAALIARARGAGHHRLSELESLRLLDAYGIPTVPTRFAADADAAALAAKELGYPVVLKIASPDLSHKTDVGGVRVDIATAVELRSACAEMLDSVGCAAPGANVSGFLVQSLWRGGCETIAGVTRDQTFGPLIMFGLGGIFAEALHDVVFRIAPIGPLDAHDMLHGIRGAAVLKGVRGAPPVRLAALSDALLRLSQLALDLPDVQELDVNPLVALPDGVVALDARVVLAP